MNKKVLVLGSYGNFGERISFSLAKTGINVILAGRSKEKVSELKEKIKLISPNSKIESASFDVTCELDLLAKLKPFVVINTCGPFQSSDYLIAKACIKYKIHYIDLSDCRDFVNNIHTLDKDAKDSGVLIVSGASTVPGLSSAVLEKYKEEFSKIESLIFGITIGGKIKRGLATTRSILSYAGKLLKPYPGCTKCYGWQDTYRQDYPELGKRWMASCNVPDLDLLPKYYGIQKIRFSAGMESSILHLGIWFISWLVRLKIFNKLDRYAKHLLYMSNWFDWLGTQNSGMHMLINGKDAIGNQKEIQWFIVAKEGHGPQVPCVPAILLAKKLIDGSMKKKGATPCIGLIMLEEYIQELQEFQIKQYIISKMECKI
ncbi:saccharopine dehydrogenase family protein [Wolbachia endosymbiont of Pentidionis agamae]|uniref:saccharopine dehydrogenase family protein n=1 Tax=Wolbachia endosymbiont of Pentidionis agamae TaxID=3110435 RepID=UPI002FCF35FA